jgi:hypothetical protein
MKLFYACLVYALMGAVIGCGVVAAVKGSVWFLIVAFLAYLIAFAKIGCLHH